MALLEQKIEREQPSMAKITVTRVKRPWWCNIPLAEIVFPGKCSFWKTEYEPDTGSDGEFMSPVVLLVALVVAAVVFWMVSKSAA